MQREFEEERAKLRKEVEDAKAALRDSLNELSMASSLSSSMASSPSFIRASSHQRPASLRGASVLEADAVKNARAADTLRRITHDPGFNVADVDLEKTVQDLISPAIVPQELFVERMVVKGYFEKLGDFHKAWRNRWFVFSLLNMNITYFENESERKIKGHICFKDIVHAVLQPPAPGAPDKRFGFLIVTDKRTYKLRGDSEVAARVFAKIISLVAFGTEAS